MFQTEEPTENGLTASDSDPWHVIPLPTKRFMPSKDSRVRSCSWFFQADIQIGRTDDGLYQIPSEVVLGLFRDHEAFRSISLPSLHTISFSVPASSDGNLLCVVCGFIRGPHYIAESAVRGWIPDSSGNHFEWTPIHGRFEKHVLMLFLTESSQSGQGGVSG